VPAALIAETVCPRLCPAYNRGTAPKRVTGKLSSVQTFCKPEHRDRILEWSSSGCGAEKSGSRIAIKSA